MTTKHPADSITKLDEAYATVRSLTAERDALRVANAELIAALKDIVGFASPVSYDSPGTLGDIARKARAALSESR